MVADVVGSAWCAELIFVPRRSLRHLTGPLVASCTLALAACGAGRAPAPPTTLTATSTPTPTPAKARGHQTATFASVALRVPAGEHAPPFNQPRHLRLPAGWRATVWARVPDARLAVWTPERRLLVSSPAAGAVFELTPGRGARASQHTILHGLTDPQGLAFDRVGGHEALYVAESDELVRYQWTHGRPGARTVLVGDLPDTQPVQHDVHRLKNVVVGPDHTIYVDIGSSSNSSLPTSWHGTPRASVIAYRPTGSRLRVLATGVRNGDGLAFAPDGTLWTAVNERDQITYPFRRAYGSTADAYGKVITSYVNEHPPDELARLTPGRNLGWPYCNPDPDVDPGATKTRRNFADMRFDADAVTNPGGSRLNCARLAPVQRGLPAHSAPLGFHFLESSRLPRPWSHGAVVAAHGSWNRKPPRAPVVYWLPWQSAGRTLGPAIALVSGFQDADGARWGRPADAVPGPDGALYVTDDTAGAVYRIVPAR
jgi:glucose/arabinose dehydrogenase